MLCMAYSSERKSGHTLVSLWASSPEHPSPHPSEHTSVSSWSPFSEESSLRSWASSSEHSSVLSWFQTWGTLNAQDRVAVGTHIGVHVSQSMGIVVGVPVGELDGKLVGRLVSVLEKWMAYQLEHLSEQTSVSSRAPFSEDASVHTWASS